MKNELKGMGKIFSFTFRRQTGTSGYKTAIILGLLLCLLVPAIIMGAMEHFGGSDGGDFTPDISHVYVVNEADGEPLDLSFFNSLGFESLSSITYVSCADYDSASAQAAQQSKSLMLIVSMDESGYLLDVVRPDSTELVYEDAEAFEGLLNVGFGQVLLQKSGIDLGSLPALTAPVHAEIIDSSDTEPDPLSGVREVLSMLLPYVFGLLMYFLVLFFGTSVSNSVIMEKNSKLMDVFLISVRPGAMVLGKTLAIALAAIIEVLVWLLSLIGGFALGTMITKAINPDTSSTLVMLFDGLGEYSGVFSVSGIIVAMLIIISGFLLYCSLSAIGGALASKPEDLSSTNVLFTLILVASFFVCMYTSIGHNGTPAIVNWIPFTATLVAPARVMLGEISVLNGLGVFALSTVLAVLITLLAGRLYKMMALHKGDPPSIGKAMGMLKSSR